MCDIGDNIKLISNSLFKKLGLGFPSLTIVILQLADHSFARANGIVEDVLVQVGSLILIVDFIILDFDAYLKDPFILGCLFWSLDMLYTKRKKTLMKENLVPKSLNFVPNGLLRWEKSGCHPSY